MKCFWPRNNVPFLIHQVFHNLIFCAFFMCKHTMHHLTRTITIKVILVLLDWHTSQSTHRSTNRCQEEQKKLFTLFKQLHSVIPISKWHSLQRLKAAIVPGLYKYYGQTNIWELTEMLGKLNYKQKAYFLNISTLFFFISKLDCFWAYLAPLKPIPCSLPVPCSCQQQWETLPPKKCKLNAVVSAVSNKTG